MPTSPYVSDEIRKTTCYMCACRCGIDVHLRDGKVRYIEGNRDHPVNKGVLCAKGSAGIMQHYSPARLKKPLKRVGPRGSGEFVEIEWDDAMDIATSWLASCRSRNPCRLAFFTGRDQSQSLTSFWAQQFGTPNYSAHGGFCSVNMAAAGIYTMGGAFWEFGSPDWDRTKLLMIFGVAEDHDSNPIKIGLGKMKERGAKIIGVNPVRTGYNAIADEWVGITPGSDGLFILALIHELLRAGAIDLEYLIRYTDAAWLIIDNPGAADHGLIARDAEGSPLICDRLTGKVIGQDSPRSPGIVIKPALKGRVVLPDGRHAVPVFEKMAEKYTSSQYAPAAVAERCGIEADVIERIAAELAHTAFEEEIVIDQPWTDWKGKKHDKMIGRPVSFHAMRGISAHANGFQTCRALHILQILLGSVEVPGGYRFKPPYPKPVAIHPTPHTENHPNAPLNGPHLGFPRGPEDLQIDEDGQPIRIDKAFSWENPLSVHGLMHMVIANAAAADPYTIDVLFLYMANMAWNSSMNTAEVIEMLTKKGDDGEYVIPKIIYSDAYSSEMVAYADLILPDTTYLERHDCISLLDRPICEPDRAADAIRWPVVEPDRDVRCFQSVLIDLAVRLGLNGFVDEEGKRRYQDYADYMVNHERRPGVGPLAGWRGENGTEQGRGKVNPDQLKRYIQEGGFWQSKIPEEAQFYKPWNAAYQKWAVDMGFFDKPQFYRFSLYLETLRKFQLAAEGYGDRVPPDHMRERLHLAFDPFPIWYPPFSNGEAKKEEGEGDASYPYHALTQRPAAMYHSWGTQNAWLRQIHGANVLFVPASICDEQKLEDGDWAWLISAHGRIQVPIKRMHALNAKTMWTWNAIGKRKGAWGLSNDASETERGFLINHLINELLPEKEDGRRWSNSDPITGQAAWFDLRVRIEKIVEREEIMVSKPQFPEIKSPVGQGPSRLRYGKEWS